MIITQTRNPPPRDIILVLQTKINHITKKTLLPINGMISHPSFKLWQISEMLVHRRQHIHEVRKRRRKSRMNMRRSLRI
jgi:hypothetical protein